MIGNARLARAAVLSLCAGAVCLWSIAASAQFGDLLRRARDRLEEVQDEVERKVDELETRTEAAVNDSASSFGAVADELVGSAGGGELVGAPLGAEGLAGSWAGVIHTGAASFRRMSFEVPPELGAGGRVSLPVLLEALPGGYSGPDGSLTVTLTYDNRAQLLTFALDGTEARQLQIGARVIRGFVDPDTSTIAGVLDAGAAGGTSFVFITRPDQIQRMLVDRLPENPWTQRDLRPGEGMATQTLERWVQKYFDEYPGVNVQGTTVGELRRTSLGLFRDDLFAPRFGATFDRISDEDVNRIFYGIQAMPRGSAQERDRHAVLNQLQPGFISASGFGYPSITLAVTAMRALDRWRGAATSRLESAPPSLDMFRSAKSVETALEVLAAHLWPSEVQALGGIVQASLERSSDQVLRDEVDRLVAGDGIEGARAINGALRTASATPGASPVGPEAQRRLRAERARAIAAEVAGAGPGAASGGTPMPEPDPQALLPALVESAPETWQALQPRLRERLDELLAAALRAPRMELGLDGSGRSGEPLERLARSKAWIDSNAAFIAEFRGSAAMDAFVGELAARREADLREAMPQLSTQVAALSSTREVGMFGADLPSAVDSATSPAWQELEALRAGRTAVIDREAFLARVGEGPFGPEHPGAVYLNALYRGDLGLIREEDLAVSQPIARTMSAMYQSTGLDQIATWMSGGMLSEGMSGVIEAQLDRYSMTHPLAGFFIVAYERVYPQCMDPDPIVFEQTTTWETVVVNGFGTEIDRYPSGSRTDYYNVNKRHADAFRKVGVVSGPEEIDLNTALFGAFVPGELTAPLRRISENLRGLRMAMTGYACDSPEMQRIERTLIGRALMN